MAYTLRQNLSPFFTAGRPRGIKGFIDHHAATTDFDGIGRTFKVAGVSAGYGVRPGFVDQYVADTNIAYHAGNWDANVEYIGIEHVNSGGAPVWPIEPATINTSIELKVDLMRRHGIKKLVPFENYFPHGYFTPTFCPGVIKDQLQAIADKVNAKIGAAPAPAPAKPAKKSNDAIATEVMAGSWGNMPARKTNLERAGYNYNDIQAIINARYGIGKPAPTKPSAAPLTTVAQQVIAGAFGNSPQREANLRKAGHDPAKVQAEVNRLLDVGPGRAVPSGGVFAVGQQVVVTNPVAYDGSRLGVSGVYTVMEVRGDRIVIGRGGQVTAAINKNNIRKA